MRDKKVENLMRRIVNLIKERWWIIVITTLIGLALAYTATNFMDREYSASVLIFANSKSDSNQNDQVTSNDVSLVNSLIADYRMFATSQTLIEKVNAELVKEQMGTISANKVSVASKDNSRAFTITVKNGDPKVCYKSAEYIADQLKSTIKEYYDMDNVEIIDHAKVPTDPIAPDVGSIMLFGGFLGFFLGVGILYIIFILDRAIKSVEDFESYFDIPVLGVIPAFDKMQVQSKVGKSSKVSSENKTTIIRERALAEKPQAKKDEPQVGSKVGGTVEPVDIYSSSENEEKDELLRKYLDQAEDILSNSDFDTISSIYSGKEETEDIL